jgi:hypothetical protein
LLGQGGPEALSLEYLGKGSQNSEPLGTKWHTSKTKSALTLEILLAEFFRRIQSQDSWRAQTSSPSSEGMPVFRL